MIIKKVENMQRSGTIKIYAGTVQDERKWKPRFPPVRMSMENQQESTQSAHLRNVLAATLQSALTAG